MIQHGENPGPSVPPAENLADGTRGRWPAALAIALGACAVAHVVATRLSWSAIPLQTDTGMWAYIGGRILDGALLYRDLWESKPPGVYYAFALVESVFGAGTDRALLWMDAALSLAVLGLTYVVARRFASRVAATLAVLLLSLVFCHRVLADWGDNVEKFVALFEISACYLVLRAVAPPPESPARPAWQWWLAAGICCGLAGLFKQTGVLFLVSAMLAAVLLKVRADPLVAQASRLCPNRRSLSDIAKAPALLCLGVLLPTLPVLCWMIAAGNFDEFWQQVVLYDLLRVGSSAVERSRLSDPTHWSYVGQTLNLALVLFGPAAVGTCFWIRGRLADRGVEGPRDQGTKGPREEEGTQGSVLSTQHSALSTPSSVLSPQSSPLSSPLLVVVLYWLLTMAVFPLAPYGYGHYLLQAAPPAAVLAAWMFDQTARLRRPALPGPGTPSRTWALAVLVAVVIGLPPLGDHLRFTFDRNCRWRAVEYAEQAREVRALVDTIGARTTAEQSVMLWPPDWVFSGYAVLYYAGRTTPLEISNADVIFKGKIGRLRPPMPELLARLESEPPDVIVDWTPVNVALPANLAAETSQQTTRPQEDQLATAAERGSRVLWHRRPGGEDTGGTPVPQELGEDTGETPVPQELGEDTGGPPVPHLSITADNEPHLLTPQGGFSLAEPPDDRHEMPEGRMLTPLKRWVRANYGGQQRVGNCTLYYHGQAWRPWQEVLLPPDWRQNRRRPTADN